MTRTPQRRPATTQRPLQVHEALNWIIHRVDRIEDKINRLLEAAAKDAVRDVVIGEEIMATLDDMVTAAEAEDTKIDSLIALMAVLKTKVDETLSGVLTPAQQAKVDKAFAAISDNPDRIQAAIDAGTTEPPAEPPFDPSAINP